MKISRIESDIAKMELDRIIRGLAFIGQAFLLLYLRDVQRKLAAYHH